MKHPAEQFNLYLNSTFCYTSSFTLDFKIHYLNKAKIKNTCFCASCHLRFFNTDVVRLCDLCLFMLQLRYQGHFTLLIFLYRNTVIDHIVINFVFYVSLYHSHKKNYSLET